MHARSLILLVCGLACSASSTSVAHEPAAEMATAAQRLLGSLDDDQRDKIEFPIDDAERENWHFVPDGGINQGAGRRGVRLDTMSDGSQLYAHGLLNSALTHRGYLTATSVMALEQLLGELEGNSERRDAGRYYVLIFGNPSPQGTWGWRFEGHHLSINVTIRDGRMFAVTPSFFGTNPARVDQGPHAGMEVLVDLEQAGFDLLAALDDAQRATAVVSDSAIEEVISHEKPRVDRKTFQPVQGLGCAELTASQRKLAQELVRKFTTIYRPEIVANTTHADELSDPNSWHFAWFGSTTPGEPHYFRLQSTSFVIELANVQNNANHVHAVWRDFDGDFGRDLLAEHYRTAHAEAAQRDSDAKVGE